MAKAISSARKSQGRPRVDATPVIVRFPPSELNSLDKWIAQQPDHPSRPLAVRRLVEQGLGSPAAADIGADAATAAAAEKGLTPDELTAENDG